MCHLLTYRRQWCFYDSSIPGLCTDYPKFWVSASDVLTVSLLACLGCEISQKCVFETRLHLDKCCESSTGVFWVIEPVLCEEKRKFLSWMRSLLLVWSGISCLWISSLNVVCLGWDSQIFNYDSFRLTGASSWLRGLNSEKTCWSSVLRLSDCEQPQDKNFIVSVP